MGKLSNVRAGCVRKDGRLKGLAAHEALVKANRDALEAIELKVAPDFTPVEKEEFRTDGSRIPIVKKRVGGRISVGSSGWATALGEVTVTP